MFEKITPSSLDQDQKNILIVYSFYSSQEKHTYVQYTAACAVIYYLIQKDVFKYNEKELLVYDYRGSRKYIWEAKKFMNDINILRDNDLLIRSRAKSKITRDVNGHQCSKLGHKYVRELLVDTEQFKNIKSILTDKSGDYYKIVLTEEKPKLVNDNIEGDTIEINGFLHNLEKFKDIKHSAFFL